MNKEAEKTQKYLEELPTMEESTRGSLLILMRQT
jgi:hypothetical protein